MSLLETLSPFDFHDLFIPPSTTCYYQNVSMGLFISPPFPLLALPWSKFLLIISILFKIDCWSLFMEFPLWRTAILVINFPLKKFKKWDKIVLKNMLGEIKECFCSTIRSINGRKWKSREVSPTFCLAPIEVINWKRMEEKIKV